MELIDANIILRYLLNDHHEMSPKAKEILFSDSVLVLTQVVAEVVYVLDGVYKIGRPDITAALRKVSVIPTVQIECRDIVLSALDEYSKSNLDFVDELLYAHSQATGYPVQSFDKALNRKLALADGKEDR